MIASRMVGVELILIGLSSFATTPSDPERRRIISPLAGDDAVQVIHYRSYSFMDPASILIAGALMMFFSNRISRVVLFDLEDEAETDRADSPTGSGSA